MGVDGGGGADLPLGQGLQQPPDPDPHPVVVPGPVGHVGQDGHALGRGEVLARHRLLDVPLLDVDDGPHRDAGALGQGPLRAGGEGRVVEPVAGQSHGASSVAECTRLYGKRQGGPRPHGGRCPAGTAAVKAPCTVASEAGGFRRRSRTDKRAGLRVRTPARVVACVLLRSSDDAHDARSRSRAGRDRRVAARDHARTHRGRHRPSRRSLRLHVWRAGAVLRQRPGRGECGAARRHGAGARRRVRGAGHRRGQERERAVRGEPHHHPGRSDPAGGRRGAARGDRAMRTGPRDPGATVALRDDPRTDHHRRRRGRHRAERRRRPERGHPHRAQPDRGQRRRRMRRGQRHHDRRRQRRARWS